MIMRTELHELGTVSHWACKRHGTINRVGAVCVVCEHDWSSTPVRPSLVAVVRQAAAHFLTRCGDALVAITDALGQW